MSMDILKQQTPVLDHSNRPVNLVDLPEFAKSNCKKCYGRGYLKLMRIAGGKWVLDHYDICPCVLKSKRLPELWEKVKHGEEVRKIEEDKRKVEAKMQENECEITSSSSVLEKALQE